MRVRYVAKVVPLKAGGFRGYVFDPETKIRLRESDFADYLSARNHAMCAAHALLGDVPYRRDAVKQSRLNQNQFYRANLWIA